MLTSNLSWGLLPYIAILFYACNVDIHLRKLLFELTKIYYLTMTFTTLMNLYRILMMLMMIISQLYYNLSILGQPNQCQMSYKHMNSVHI